MTAQAKMMPQAETAGPFVVNLCASTSPMALLQPDAPELKRFNFFVSRRREDGRERFRLHMGYFLTLAEAEEWLNVVRDIYPGAWAGEAPGKKLAARAAAAAAPKVAAAAPLVAAPLPITKPAIAPPAPAPTPPPVVPTVHAAPHANGALAAKETLSAGSNIREVLKALDDTDDTRLMPSPVAKPAAAPARAPAPLSDSQVLKILENRRPENAPRGKEEGGNGIALLRPDDTTTVRELKDAVRANAPLSFAVQLQWSVQPIDLTRMPPLAIFSAYTLYTVEGSRDGRKWYGLRLGFFGDAISAKQVAGYVRSEFASVAVIPVSSQERSRATDGEKAPGRSAAPPRKAPQKRVDEFKLIDDQTDAVTPPRLAAAHARLQAKKAFAAPAKLRKKAGGRVRATEKRSPKTLEETLEILGAGDLEVDNGRGELLNDSGVRHLRVQVQKNSPFSKLLERLSERARKA